MMHVQRAAGRTGLGKHRGRGEGSNVRAAMFLQRGECIQQLSCEAAGVGSKG